MVGLTAAAAASGGLLAGCATPATRRPGTGGATAAAPDKLTALTPSYAPFQGAKPDIPGTVSNLPGVPGYGGGFTKYPSPLTQAVPQKLGKGGTYTAMTPLWAPVPPGLADNSFFQAVNAQIGANIDFQIADGNTYVDKATARMASGDLPDIMVIPSWEIDKMADFNTAVDKAFEDLTPYLQGDKVKAYPLLANLPTAAWQWSVWNGKLMAVPFPTEPFPLALLYRKDIFAENGWQPPKTADELYQLGKEINDPRGERWAFGDIHEMMWPTFRVPQEWRLVNGKLVHKYETQEWEAMLAFMRKLFDEDLIHPNVVSSKGANEKDLFAAGQITVFRDGIGGWRPLLDQQRPKNPEFDIDAMPLFAADGGKPIHYHNNAAGIFTFIKKGLPKEKIEEILAILNYTAAPFGTKEYEMYTYGVEGEHFTRDDNGVPQKTELGLKEAAESYIFLGGRPLVTDWVAYPDAVVAAAKWHNDSFKYIEPQPHSGIRVQRPSQLSALQQPTEDKFTDIMRGRRPIGDIKQIVDEWRRDGGNEGRDFYMKVLQDNGRA